MSRGSDEDLVFKALAHPTRRQMLDLLREESRTTSDLCGAFPDLDRCTVMQHLGVLEKSGLVVSAKQGRTRVNHLNVGPLLDIQKRWLGGFQGSALEGLARLADQP